MGAKSGLALKSLQWLVRAVQFLCALLVLAVYSYLLAALANHGLPIATSSRAVDGIAGAAVLYTLVGLVLCCVAGHRFTSSIAILLDVAFAAAFIYVAYANRHGARRCHGELDTPLGTGDESDVPDAPRDGFTGLPTFGTACRLQTACLAVAVVAIVFFLLAIFVEVALVRHHRKAKRFGPGPANDYTEGYGSKGALGGLASRFRRKPKSQPADQQGLPEHLQPGQLDGHGQQAAAAAAAAANKPTNGYGY